MALREEVACSGQIVDAAMTVHSLLGPGLLESVYELCLARELRERGLVPRAQVPFPISYRGIEIEAAYRLDLIVNDKVVVEVKAVAKLMPVHQAQLLSYLRLSGDRVGLLINFHEPRLKDGIRRLLTDRPKQMNPQSNVSSPCPPSTP
jgi:GxxExxY protein